MLNTTGGIDKVEHYTCDKLFLNAGSTGTSELLLKSQAEGKLNQLNEHIGQHWEPNGNAMTGRNFVHAAGPAQSTIPVKGLNMWDGDREGSKFRIFAELAPLPLGLETWTTLYLPLPTTQNVATITMIRPQKPSNSTGNVSKMSTR